MYDIDLSTIIHAAVFLNHNLVSRAYSLEFVILKSAIFTALASAGEYALAQRCIYQAVPVG